VEVVARLQAFEHAAEVLADKVFEELRAGVAVWKALFFEDFVGEVGAGLEGERFGEDKSVVAVEEDVFDLGWGEDGVRKDAGVCWVRGEGGYKYCSCHICGWYTVCWTIGGM